jgi:hypothetical protein
MDSMNKRNVSRCALLAVGALLTAVGCGGDTGVKPVSAPTSAAVTESPQTRRAVVPTVVAAGDISPARIGAQQATSDLVLRLDPTRVLALGDEQYHNGTLAEFRQFYAPTWGRFKGRTHPTPGNHEYNTAGAAGYFSYFGAAARPDGSSFYSFDLGGWHVVSLNSNIARSATSPQLSWLRADLRQSSKRCVLAFWHHPRFSSGRSHGGDPSVAPFWRALYQERADLVLNGHEHSYERFAPQTPSGERDGGGIREFVVGTGGGGLYQFGTIRSNSQARIADSYGVLRLFLEPQSYRWQFVNTNGRVLDSGGPRSCH